MNNQLPLRLPKNPEKENSKINPIPIAIGIREKQILKENYFVQAGPLKGLVKKYDSHSMRRRIQRVL